MTAGPFTPYDQGLLGLLDRTIDFVGGTTQARLLRASYTPQLASHSVWNDVSVHECSDTDYAPLAVAGRSIVYAPEPGRVEYRAADLNFGNTVTIEAKYLILLQWTGTAGTSRLIGLANLNTAGPTATVASTSDDFKLTQLTPFFTIERQSGEG